MDACLLFENLLWIASLCTTLKLFKSSRSRCSTTPILVSPHAAFSIPTSVSIGFVFCYEIQAYTSSCIWEPFPPSSNWMKKNHPASLKWKRNINLKFCKTILLINECVHCANEMRERRPKSITIKCLRSIFQNSACSWAAFQENVKKWIELNQEGIFEMQEC